MVITYILGVGDRHYDNILITKGGNYTYLKNLLITKNFKILHITLLIFRTTTSH